MDVMGMMENVPSYPPNPKHSKSRVCSTHPRWNVSSPALCDSRLVGTSLVSTFFWVMFPPRRA